MYAAVEGGCYSVGYSVARFRSDHLDANYRRGHASPIQTPSSGVSEAVRASGCAPSLLYSPAVRELTIQCQCSSARGFPALVELSGGTITPECRLRLLQRPHRSWMLLTVLLPPRE